MENRITAYIIVIAGSMVYLFWNTIVLAGAILLIIICWIIKEFADIYDDVLENQRDKDELE